MKHCGLIFAFVFLDIQNRNDCERQPLKPGGIHYSLRVLNFTTLDSTNQPYMKNVKLVSRNNKQYLSADIIARRPYVIRRIHVRFERCRDLEFACEDFQTWNLTKICLFLRMKNQAWSPLVDAIDLKRFPQTCPRVEQETYIMRNATFDMDWINTFYSEGLKYYWKVHVFFFNPKNEIEHQYHGHAHFITYTNRNGSSFSQFKTME